MEIDWPAFCAQYRAEFGQLIGSPHQVGVNVEATELQQSKVIA